VHTASRDRVSGTNLAYTVHFYASSPEHQEPVRNYVRQALSAGVAVFATEWGTCEYDGNGALNFGETQKWLDFMADNYISDANWAISDKSESCSAMRGGASGSGGWSESQLTESGRFLRNSIRAFSEGVTGASPTPSGGSPTPGGGGCCKWGGSCGDCGNDNTGWCHQSAGNCDACTGSFDPSATAPSCGTSPVPLPTPQPTVAPTVPRPPPTPQPTPQPSPMPTPQPTPQPTPLVQPECPTDCSDAVGMDTPWRWTCRDLKDQGHCNNPEVQKECPQSCGTCGESACTETQGNGTPWGFSCAVLATSGYCIYSEVQRECPKSCENCR
jgi:hypothetical protein